MSANRWTGGFALALLPQRFFGDASAAPVPASGAGTSRTVVARDIGRARVLGAAVLVASIIAFGVAILLRHSPVYGGVLPIAALLLAERRIRDWLTIRPAAPGLSALTARSHQ